MKQAQQENSKPLPGLIATLTAGFELTTSHPWLVALPIIVDLFFWLGPRLSVERMMLRYERILAAEPGLSGMADQVAELASGYNLFTALSVPLAGVPTLMGGASPETTPLAPAILRVEGWLGFGGLFIVLTLAGVFLAASYLSLIALALRKPDEAAIYAFKRVVNFAKSTALAWIRLLALGVFLIITILVILLPLLPVAYLAALLSQGLAIVVLMLGIVFVVTYLSMSVPGIVLDGRPVGESVVHSVRFVRRFMSPTMNILFVIIIVGWGTNLLWRLADTGNWLTIVSIAGHGFVSTALVSAIFIYYQDRTAVHVHWAKESNDKK